MNHRTRAFFSATVLLLLGVAPLAAQDPAGRSGSVATSEGMPDGWMMRLDRAAAGPGAADFRVMEPGWHVTTGRAGAAIFWRPDMRATDDLEATALIHLMSPAPHPEAFGIFVGGQDLETPDQSYLYFLVRQTGEYLIKRRVGDETETVVEWTRHSAIPVATDEATRENGSTAYELEIDVEGNEVEFSVNDETVTTLPAAELQTDGVGGIRINHRLDVHVEELTLEDDD